jgi:osmotically-inducible protein OsmY
MTDKQLQESVLAALKWTPSLDHTQIGVTVKQGVVALRGDVRSFSERMLVERVTLRVYGVKGLANELNVRFAGSLEPSDTDIALAVVNTLKWNSLIPRNSITPAVSKGWVTLTGELDWNYQRLAAAGAVRGLEGVRGVTNDIKIRPPVNVADAAFSDVAPSAPAPDYGSISTEYAGALRSSVLY